MTLAKAISILKKECEFLGIDEQRLCEFIEESPMAFPVKAVEAFKVFKQSKEA